MVSNDAAVGEKPLEKKQQQQIRSHQQQQHQQKQVQPPATTRWREKEAEFQHRLTEREREIGRLKEKLRDLTKKLKEHDQVKVSVRKFG